MDPDTLSVDYPRDETTFEAALHALPRVASENGIDLERPLACRTGPDSEYPDWDVELTRVGKQPDVGGSTSATGPVPTRTALYGEPLGMPRFAEGDEGKTVIDPVGDEVGIVEGVEDSTAYVIPTPTGRIESRPASAGRTSRTRPSNRWRTSRSGESPTRR